MRRIIYYVATSLDGFIAGPGGDTSSFSGKGNGVEEYLSDLKEFDTVIMGRKTYEFGYDFGLEPGQLAYPHMEHYIFSTTLAFEQQHSSLHIREPDLDEILEIRQKQGTDIYLCGGGEFAGWLLDHQQVDMLKIKLNPILLGEGIKMFGASNADYQLKLEDSRLYEFGLQIMTYRIIY